MKAIFLDFYGTVVQEVKEVTTQICQKISMTANSNDVAAIDLMWWVEFQKLFAKANEDDFVSQRELEINSLDITIKHYQSRANAKELCKELFDYWMKPKIFDDSEFFFNNCPLPIYIVSNIDDNDIIAALNYLNLKPAGVFTSEEARSYKPHNGIFEMALNKSGLMPKDVIHIGDSLSSDVKGASDAGIRHIWMNRINMPVPPGVTAASDFETVMKIITSEL